MNKGTMARQVNSNSVNPFTPIPNGLIGVLEGYEWGVLFALRYHGLEAYPSHKRISEIAGISVRSVQRTLESLRRKGIISWDPRTMEDGHQSSNMYKLHLDGAWRNPVEIETAPSPTGRPPSPTGRPPTSVRPTPLASQADEQDLDEQDLDEQVEARAAVLSHPFPMPRELLEVEKEVRTFWTKHKCAKSMKTPAAWDLQMRNLLKILKDPGGGINAIKEQLEKAEEASIISKAWQAITYANWQKYGKPHAPIKGSRAYTNSVDRPGLPIQKLTIEEIRSRQC